MKVAVEGCCHGELDKIYETLDYLEKKNNIKIDLLLICGDFQAVRNKSDLQCMAVPPKYQKLNTFYKYYSGEKKAPYLTVFIGGNHEASNYLQELPYGGWVAHNIYYLGYAGIIQVGGVRIGGLSGIFKGKDLHKGHFEHLPYDQETKRSVYHVRNLEVFRMKQISRKLDIFMSHDWPRGIYNFGNVEQLLKRKKFFREEVESNRLGSPVGRDLLYHLKPDYWFAAHLHVKFAALVQHQMDDREKKVTKFLSLDKCLPRRKFLQILDVPNIPDKPLTIQLDPEWLAILKSTNHLLNLTKGSKYMPGPGSSEKWDFSVTQEQINSILDDFGGDLSVPENFELTAPTYDPSASAKKVTSPELRINPQTTLLCTMLDITDPTAVFLGKDTNVKPEMLDSADTVDGEEKDDDDDDADDDDTEYESEPSFISVSGSERSFMSSSTADESLLSFNNPNEISMEEETDPNVSDIKDVSSNPDEISISEDEDDEFKEIMKAQKKVSKPALVAKIDKFSRSPLRLFPPYRSPSSSADEKSASPCKSSMTTSDIDDTDAELQEILAAQKRSQKEENEKLKSAGQLELAITGSEEDEEDEFQEIIAQQKKSDGELKCELVCGGPVCQSSPGSSEDRSDTDVTHTTKGLEPLTDKVPQKRIDGSESEDSPQTKRLKRRNQQLYVSNETNE